MPAMRSRYRVLGFAFLAAVGSGCFLWTWLLPTPLLEVHDDDPGCGIFFSADSSTCVTVKESVDATIRKWDIRSGKCQVLQQKNRMPIRLVALSEDGKRVAVHAADIRLDPEKNARVHEELMVFDSINDPQVIP